MYEYEVRIDFLNCNRWTRTIRDAPYLLRFALLLKTPESLLQKHRHYYRRQKRSERDYLKQPIITSYRYQVHTHTRRSILIFKSPLCFGNAGRF